MKKLFTMILLIVLSIGVGCEHKIGKKISDFELGKGKLISENAPIEAIQYLQKVLKKEPQNLEVRCYLTIAYKRAAVDAITKLHGSEEKYIKGQQREFEKLKNIGAPAAEKLIDIVRARNRIHKDAMEVLVDMGEVAVQPLVDALIRYVPFHNEGVEILTKIGSSAVEGLGKALDSPSTPISVRADIVKILGNINDTKAKPILQKQLNSPNKGLRMEAIVSLYKLGDKEYAGKIVAGLKESDLNARRAAAEGLINVNSAPIDELIKALNDSDNEVRLYVVKALEKHPDKKAIEPLIKTLENDNHPDVQNAAADALIPYGKSIAKRLIEELRKENNWEVRIRIVNVLKNDEVMKGIDAEGEYELFEYYNKKEDHKMVKNEINDLLRKLEKK